MSSLWRAWIFSPITIGAGKYRRNLNNAVRPKFPTFC